MLRCFLLCSFVLAWCGTASAGGGNKGDVESTFQATDKLYLSMQKHTPQIEDPRLREAFEEFALDLFRKREAVVQSRKPMLECQNAGADCSREVNTVYEDFQLMRRVTLFYFTKAQSLRDNAGLSAGTRKALGKIVADVRPKIAKVLGISYPK